MTARATAQVALLWGLATVAAAGCGSESDICDPTVPGTLCTIAGTGDSGYDGDATRAALDAKLSLPQDTLMAPSGELYIVDWNNHRIRLLDQDGQLHWVAGQGEIGGTLDDPAASDFNHLTNIIWDCQGGADILIAAWHNSKIRRLDTTTGEVTDTCGDGRRAYFGDEGEAATSSLDLPASLACAPNGDLVVMDQANQVLRRIDAEGIIHRLAGSCVIDAAPPSGPGPCDAPVACPGGSGKMTCGDPAVTCSSPCTPSWNGDNVAALEARFAQPFGQSAEPAGRIVYDQDGNLLFADTANHLIRRLTPEGIIEVIAGTPPEDGVPQRGYAGDGGPATEALLYNPVDLALADDGTLYFTDVYNHCVRAISPDGIIDTVAGQCETPGFAGDGGPAAEALLKLPFGVNWHQGTLYIADSGNHRIRAFPLE